MLLFILCVNILTCLLVNEEFVGNFHGIKVLRNAPTISYLMYANDLFIMYRASSKEVEVVMGCFNKIVVVQGKMLIWLTRVFTFQKLLLEKLKEKSCGLCVSKKREENPST